MTQIRKFAVTLLATFAALGVLSLVPAGADQPAAPVLQTQMRSVDLPSEAFTALVFGTGTEVSPLEAERLGNIAEDVCAQFGKGFTYTSIREGLVAVHGFSVGEAGLLMSAAAEYEC